MASNLEIGDQNEGSQPDPTANTLIPYCSDGWHKDGCWMYYVFKSYMSVNACFSCLSTNALFGLLCLNAMFSILSLNSIFSILSMNSSFSILSSGSFMALGCSGEAYKICY